MSCYKPMTGFPTGEYWPSGKPKYHFKYCNPEDVIKARQQDPRVIVIPCGTCYGCRMDYARKWSDRMMMELEVQKKAVFITLTYDDDHVNIAYDEDTGEVFGLTLNKKDCQKFIKDLRRYFEYHKDLKLRFYMNGEYGEHTHRPHYHAIIYGIDLDDLECKEIIGKNDLGQPYFKSPVLDKVWKKGYTIACKVTYETCNYVSRYVAKKVNDTWDPEAHCLVKEFAIMSRKPGIGYEWIKLHPDWKEYDTIQLPEGRKAQIPRFLTEKFLSEDERMKRKVNKTIISESDIIHHLEESKVSMLDSLIASEELRKQKGKILSRNCV